MGVHYSPKIVTDQLVLHLDASNPKSFRGEPTINIANTDLSQWNVDGSGQSNVGTRTKVSDTCVKIVDITSNTRLWYIIPGLLSSTTYTISIKYYKISGTPTLRFQLQDLFNGSYQSTLAFPTTSQLGISDIDGWQTASYTITLGTSSNQLQIYLQDGDDYTTYTHSFLLKEIQVEQKSYPTPFVNGTRGSTYSTGGGWGDLSGYGNHASMYNIVPSETDKVKCFNFSTVTGAYASSASMGFTFTKNMVNNIGNFTFSTWVKNPHSSGGQQGLFSNAGGGDGYRFGIELEGIYYLVGPTYKEGVINFTNVLTTTDWYNVTLVFNRTELVLKLYLNGVFQNSVTIPSNQTTSGNGAPGIVRSSCCGVFMGKISTFSVYNRALSVSEILQNYNATKGKFI